MHSGNEGKHFNKSCIKLSTNIIKGISRACLYYVDLILASLKNELDTTYEKSEKFSSRKEKWLATIQSVVADQQEVSSFHFHYLICIKLNNIEWAQKQLEEIEHAIDSEKQSTILARKRAKDPSAQNNESGSYWFTLRIIRATDLRACDSNGLSDPYLAITDNEKDVGKTHTIYETLDPVWDETFEIERSEDVLSEPLKMTIWDENSYTDNQVCGKARLNLNPDDYVDFVPVEKWLEISPKGKLLVSITMESEQDDICYYFGKSLRRLMLAESEIVSMIVVKFSELITFYISKNTLNSLLGVKGYKEMFTGIFKYQPGSANTFELDEDQVANSLDPLFETLNANFKILSQHLTKTLRDKVMLETWNGLLESLELLLMPPLSEKKTSQVELNESELTIVRVWSDTMLLFFHNGGNGIPLVDLKGVKYNSFFMALSYYYSADTQVLMQECTDRALESIMQLIEPVSALNITPRRDSAVSISSANTSTTAISSAKARVKATSIASYRNQVELRKLKRVNSMVEQSKELEILLLRILRMRGEYEYVERLLSQKTNLAVSLTS